MKVKVKVAQLCLTLCDKTLTLVGISLSVGAAASSCGHYGPRPLSGLTLPWTEAGLTRGDPRFLSLGQYCLNLRCWLFRGPSDVSPERVVGRGESCLSSSESLLIAALPCLPLCWWGKGLGCD